MNADLRPDVVVIPGPHVVRGADGSDDARVLPRCRWCDGTGWADPWEVTDGSPELTWCPCCLGAGLEDCDGCDGEGSVPVPVPCPCEGTPADGRERAA